MDINTSISTSSGKTILRRLSVVKLSFLCFWVMLFLLTARATTYHVDAVNGDDSNPGTSPNLAFRTIQKAADIMTAGDSCLVQSGEYDERVNINTSGSSNSSIKFQAIGTVITKGFKIRADYIHIIGFEMTLNGVSLRGKHCQIINNYIHDLDFVGVDLITDPLYADNSTVSFCIVKGNTISYAVKCGIRIMGQNNLIENNDISHTLACSPFSNYCNDADGIRFFGSGHTIRKNYIHDILHEPENFNDPHIDFFQTWSTAYNIIFEQNLCVSPNVSGSNQILMLEEQEGEVVKDLIFKNNIFIMSDPGYSPMHISNKRAGETVENFTIVNNTFFHRNINGMGEYAILLKNTKNVKIHNNIFYDFGDSSKYKNYVFIQDIAENINIGNNCVYITNGHAPYGGPYPNDLWMVNPEFVDPLNQNFYLQENSPMINAGMALSEVIDDIVGTPRPQGPAYDIGAYEYIDSINSNPSPPTNLKISK